MESQLPVEGLSAKVRQADPEVRSPGTPRPQQFQHPRVDGFHFSHRHHSPSHTGLIANDDQLPALRGEAAEGLGIDDRELREKVGEDRITLFRRHGA